MADIKATRTLVFQQFYECFSEKVRECLTNAVRSFAAQEKRENKIALRKTSVLEAYGCQTPPSRTIPAPMAKLSLT